MTRSQDPGADDFGPPVSAVHRLVAITFDANSIGRGTSNIEQERGVAIYDIIEANYFAPMGPDGQLRQDGPFTLMLGLSEDRLVMTIAAGATPDKTHAYLLSLSPLKKVMKDYFTVCESYYQAIRTQPPSKIQAIDMGRRGLHNDGSRLLTERLDGKIALDHDTSRRLFTLICALHWKG
jgi:uncharacterized protein (UPF0262 family)